jgi:adenylate kinase family enzyme
MIAAVIGYPGSGRRTFAGQLVQRLPHLIVVGFDEIRGLLKSSASETAVAARHLVDAGRLIPDPVLGELLAEAASSRSVLLVGYPRNLAQLQSLQSTANEAVHVIHVRASAELIDDRRRAQGLRPVEQAHPGVLARIDAALDPMIAVAHRLLPLDATSDIHDRLEAAQRFLAAS